MNSLEPECTYTDEVRQIAELVFATMLRLSIHSMPSDTAPPPGLLTGALYFAGCWQGALLVECSGRDAALIAHRLTGIPLPDRVDDDVRDSLAEIVNMIGGNLKPVLPHGVALSMPSVIEGRQYALRLAATVVTREAFRFGQDPAWLTLLQMPEQEK